jgi:hypothetical protein
MESDYNLHLKLYKIILVQAIEEGDYDRIMDSCNWLLRAAHDSVIDPKLTFFTDEAQFHLIFHQCSKQCVLEYH